MNYTNRKTPGCGPTGCPKAGIKIHETPTTNTNTFNNSRQQVNYNNNNDAFNIATKKSNVRAPVSFHQTTMSDLDLNIDNYSLEDLYNFV